MSTASADRKYIFDELSRKKTLLQGEFAYIAVDFQNLSSFPENPKKTPCTRNNLLLLGLGADIKDILPYCENKETVYWLDCPDFIEQFPQTPPENFIPLSPEELPRLCSPDFFTHTDILFYRQNIQLFPRFWNNILISLRSFAVPASPQPRTNRHIFLTGGKTDLLHAELMQAIKEIGFIPVETENKSLQELLELLDRNPPCLFLSVNAQSLDGNGTLAEYLRQKHIPLALWFVDNPWNILSNFAQDWWKDCPIFLTDFTFAEELAGEGAKNLYPLPLAGHGIACTYRSLPSIPLFFVGNSAFANKQLYFSGCKLEQNFKQNLYSTIKKQLSEKKSLPDFHSLRQQLFPQDPLWPGKKQRLASYAAAKADLCLRRLWLDPLSPIIHIMGDSAWQNILTMPHTFYPPCSYYHDLPNYYRTALFTLNLTSLLMPGNLSQRHFDVWNNGGFLLSSPSSGMNIFPSDVVSLITVKSPESCLKRLELLMANPALKHDVQTTMRQEIQEKHTYAHRLRAILEYL